MEDNTNNQVNHGNNTNISKVLKFGTIEDKELEAHLKIIKKWLAQYNNFNADSCATNSISSSQDKITTKNSLTRVKFFIDYYDLILGCPNFALAVVDDFLKYYKYVQKLIRRILLASKKINEDSAVFSDVIILNFPHIFPRMNYHTFSSLIQIKKNRGGILGFAKAFVYKVNPPIFLLWSKKILYTCNCKGTNIQKKFFNIFKLSSNEIKFNSDFHETMCPHCKKDLIHDQNSDIFIECQEIMLTIEIEDKCIVNNQIQVWAYGDLVNSVKEGNCVSLVAFYMPDSSNVQEKDFEFGTFIALNFNICFTSLSLLKETDFHLEKKNVVDSVLNRPMYDFSSKFNENTKDIDVLRSVKFQRELIVKFCKIIFQTYTRNLELLVKSKAEPSEVNCYQNSGCAFLNLVLDLSITQRDYLNYIIKTQFFQEEDNAKGNAKANKEGKGSDYHASLAQSRTLVFKSRIFNSDNKTKHNAGGNEEYKQYFRISKQISYSLPSTTEFLLCPLHLFLIFDDLKNDGIYSNVKNYAKYTHSKLINVYPFFNHLKSDKASLHQFLIQCNNGVILIPDIDILSKQEIEVISSIMNDSTCNSSVNTSIFNITFWFCCSFHRISNPKNGKKKRDEIFSELKINGFDQILSKCEIILNLSTRYNKQRGVLETKRERNNPSCFLNIHNHEQMLCDKFSNMKLLQETLNDLCNQDHFFNTTDCPEEDFNNSFSAAKLMEDYFIIKRNLTKIGFDDLFSLLRIAMFVSMLRMHYDKKVKILQPTMIANMNYIDVLITIFLNEENAIFKYGLENSSFGNLISKIIMHDYSEELSWIVKELEKPCMIDNKNNNSTMIPKTKSSMKKVDLNWCGLNAEKKTYSCNFCNMLLKMNNENEKLFSFLEKLTIFTYNN